MASNVILSTGLKNAMSTRGLKELVNGCVLKIFSGSIPTTADDSESGILLVTITKDGSSWSADVCQKNSFEVTNVGSNGDTIKVTITPSGSDAEEHTYTKTSSEDTTAKVANAVAELISSNSVYMNAVSLDSDVILFGRFGGESFTVNVSVTGSITVNPSGNLTNITGASVGNGLHFEKSTDISDGTLEKLGSESWRGSVIQSGTAQWFRLLKYSDTGSSSTTAIRIQGLVGTLSDSPLIFSGSTSLSSGTTLSISDFSITIG